MQLTLQNWQMMESPNDLNARIFSATQKIQAEFPELVKYLDEIPTTYSDATTNKISQENLIDYYNTLNALLKSFSKEH